jgi:uncharacterized membrane protein YjfL (UPF0719 family)
MLESVGFAALFGGLGVVMCVIGYRLFDLVETRIDLADEIKKGNLAAAVVIGAFLLGICFIIGRAVGG